MSGDITITLCYSELSVEMTAQGVSYAPDAVNDMMTQATKAFSDVLSELRGHGIIRTFNDEDELSIGVELEEEEEEEEEE